METQARWGLLREIYATETGLATLGPRPGECAGSWAQGRGGTASPASLPRLPPCGGAQAPSLRGRLLSPAPPAPALCLALPQPGLEPLPEPPVLHPVMCVLPRPPTGCSVGPSLPGLLPEGAGRGPPPLVTWSLLCQPLGSCLEAQQGTALPTSNTQRAAQSVAVLLLFSSSVFYTERGFAPLDLRLRKKSGTIRKGEAPGVGTLLPSAGQRVHCPGLTGDF